MTNSKYKNRLMNQEIRMWSKVLENLKSHIDEDKLNILDIGAASGNLLLAAFKNKLLNKGFLVDHWWNGYQKEFLLDNKKDDIYYNKKRISIFPINGLDKSIPFHEANMVVMTYCQGIMWDDLYPKISTTKYIIAENAWGGMLLNQQELELISNFSLSPQSKYHKTLREKSPEGIYPYYFFKRKDNF